MTYDTTNDRLYVYNGGWKWVAYPSALLLTSSTPVVEVKEKERKIRSRSGSTDSMYSEKESTSFLTEEIGKLARLPEERYRAYMQMIDRCVKMRRAFGDLEDTSHADLEDNSHDSQPSDNDGEWDKVTAQ